MRGVSQFDLLRRRRFGPFCLAQFLGACNDNLFRGLLAGFLAVRVSGGLVEYIPSILAALFMLPYLALSPLVGQLTDKVEKSLLIRRVKALEVLIAPLAAWALVSGQVFLGLAALLLMGIQSALFGPVKFAILPRHLTERELTGGNGLVVATTLVAILLGTWLGFLLLPPGGEPSPAVAGLVVLLALTGWLASLAIPPAAATAPQIELTWNPLRGALEVVRLAAAERSILLSILAISWFWLFGTAVLAQVPPYVAENLSGGDTLLRAVLSVFAAGIVLGALVCEALGGRRVELGLVPIGAAGLTFFPLLLVLAGPAPLAGRPLDMAEFLAWREASQVMLAIGFTGFSGGLFVVPLYALVQQRTAPEHCGRVFAANNLFNAAFILAGTLITFLLGWAGLDVAQTITVIAVMNAAVALYIFAQVPEFVMRFIVWILVHTMYRVEKQGLEHIPDEGATVLVCNHVSYMDALVIMANSPRPIRFVMTHKIFQIPVLSFVFRHAKAIPIASSKEDPDLLGQAYERIAAELEAGQLVCIFPEGHLTADGEMDVFRPGIERIVARTPVPVVPLALKGLWGSFFSRKDKDAVLKLPRRLWSRIGLAASSPVPPGRVSAADLHDRVLAMRGDWL